MSLLRSNVVAARQRLAEAQQRLREAHAQGMSGVEISAAITDARDAVLRDLFEAALDDLGESGPDGLIGEVALVAHGGYGRRDVAPHSDVDLMILHTPASTARVAPLAERLLRDVFDVGLVLGHSVRTVEQALRLGVGDAEIGTSLVESRFLCGNRPLLDGFVRRFGQHIRQRSRTLVGAIEQARLKERLRYGETVFLLEPNIKRSHGGLRDLQLVRWIGFVRYGANEPAELRRAGALSDDDLDTIRRANEFLLCLRNELHFHACHAADVLSRAEQVRIAELRGYEPLAGLLPVEQFMRDYFRHTRAVAHLVERFVATAQTRPGAARLVTAAFGHRVEGGIRVGPAGLVANRRALGALRGDLNEIMRLVHLANLYDKPIAGPTWEAIRREAARLPEGVPQGACLRFRKLLEHPPRLAELIRALHEVGLLERFLPEFKHARGLLQFNQYHKYTVDEHCLRALEFATELRADDGIFGKVYRRIAQKDVLHLALLIHDLGKGYPEDHSERGRQIAVAAAERLGLSRRKAEMLQRLVHRHLLMNHLAFRRDTADQQLVVHFAVEVGSPELLQMLFVMTAADFAAVGPGVWDGWKAEILTDLYHRTMQHLAADSSDAALTEPADRRRRQLAERLAGRGDEAWFVRQIEQLPADYLQATEPDQAAGDLRMLHDLPPGESFAEVRYSVDTGMLEVTVGTSEQVTPGIFHKLCGALSSRGLQIRAAQIHTLADGLVLDRFWVFDPDYAGQSPEHRLAEIRESLLRSLGTPGQRWPTFRRTWQSTGHEPAMAHRPQTRTSVDNHISRDCTVLDVFALDRPGLLYAVARTLFELGLSVSRAKIGTFLDQVVDVFYVTDEQGRKIEDDARLEEIRATVLEAIEELGE